MLEKTATKNLSDVLAYDRQRMREWLEEKVAAGKKTPHVGIYTLTPVLASLLLERNPLNRRMNRRNFNQLLSDIENKRYVFNGQPIIVSDTGIVNDGQHRCLACVESGESIPVIIVFGPKESSRFTVDTGKSKNTQDFLHMKGRKYNSAAAAVLGYYLMWKRNGDLAMGSDVRPTIAEKLELEENMSGLYESIEVCMGAPCKVARSVSVLAFCHYLFKKAAGVEAADYFVTKLGTGDNLKRGDPILYLRNKLTSLGEKKTSLLRANERAHLIIRAWNAYRRGEAIEKMAVLGGKLPKVEK
jgi:hypothetical protein